MRVVPVPCLRDNYAYLLVCEATNLAAVVDPSEAEPVRAAAEAEGVGLGAIWNTHHHWDHTGGNKKLLEAFPELEVIGHSSDKGRIPGQSRFADDGEEVSLGEEIRAQVIHNPGHTSGAISYYLADPGWVFTGDTLFGAGCGRLFEGTPGQMYASLSRLASLPEDTEVYCGHEYTASNLRFAAEVEPENAAIAERRRQVEAARGRGEPTVPFTVADERETNPFLRAAAEAVIAAARLHQPGGGETPVDVFATIRRWKDNF
jgi:hydroxyacylglutathione hydrolase